VWSGSSENTPPSSVRETSPISTRFVVSGDPEFSRLVDEDLVRRADADTDGRGVLVALTDAGVAHLAETAPAHARGISTLFVAQLEDQELAILEQTLSKVIIDCSFG
jgi:hypothetical protein